MSSSRVRHIYIQLELVRFLQFDKNVFTETLMIKNVQNQMNKSMIENKNADGICSAKSYILMVQSWTLY